MHILLCWFSPTTLNMPLIKHNYMWINITCALRHRTCHSHSPKAFLCPAGHRLSSLSPAEETDTLENEGSLTCPRSELVCELGGDHGFTAVHRQAFNKDQIKCHEIKWRPCNVCWWVYRPCTHARVLLLQCVCSEIEEMGRFAHLKCLIALIFWRTTMQCDIWSP